MNEGKVIIFPTDTVYGMGAFLNDRKGLSKIFDIKKRNIAKKIPLLIPDIISVNAIANYNLRDLKIMKKYWPGPLTLILNTTEAFRNKFKLNTIALRIPNNPIATDLLKDLGPIWTTSVNVSGEPALSDVNIIKEKYLNKVDKIYEDDDFSQSEKASTIVDLTDTEKIKFLRIGQIKEKEILKVVQ